MSYTINDVQSDVFHFIKMLNYIGKKWNIYEHTLQQHSTKHLKPNFFTQ